MAYMEPEIVKFLSAKAEGAKLSDVEDMLRNQGYKTLPGNAEAIMLLSEKTYEQNGYWRRRITSKADAIYEALSTYTAENNRAVFKLDSALADLPIQFRPTVDEIPNIISRFQGYELLKNNMVRRKG